MDSCLEPLFGLQSLKLTNLLKIDFQNTPTKGLAWVAFLEQERNPFWGNEFLESATRFLGSRERNPFLGDSENATRFLGIHFGGNILLQLFLAQTLQVRAVNEVARS